AGEYASSISTQRNQADYFGDKHEGRNDLRSLYRSEDERDLCAQWRYAELDAGFLYRRSRKCSAKSRVEHSRASVPIGGGRGPATPLHDDGFSVGLGLHEDSIRQPNEKPGQHQAKSFIHYCLLPTIRRFPEPQTSGRNNE